MFPRLSNFGGSALWVRWSREKCLSNNKYKQVYKHVKNSNWALMKKENLMVTMINGLGPHKRYLCSNNKPKRNVKLYTVIMSWNLKPSNSVILKYETCWPLWCWLVSGDSLVRHSKIHLAITDCQCFYSIIFLLCISFSFSVDQTIKNTEIRSPHQQRISIKDNLMKPTMMIEEWYKASTWPSGSASLSTQLLFHFVFSILFQQIWR